MIFLQSTVSHADYLGPFAYGSTAATIYLSLLFLIISFFIIDKTAQSIKGGRGRSTADRRIWSKLGLYADVWIAVVGLAGLSCLGRLRDTVVCIMVVHSSICANI